jgi:hypothetical protein
MNSHALTNSQFTNSSSKHPSSRPATSLSHPHVAPIHPLVSTHTPQPLSYISSETCLSPLRFSSLISPFPIHRNSSNGLELLQTFIKSPKPLSASAYPSLLIPALPASITKHTSLQLPQPFLVSVNQGSY